jgi:hypothetical protein
MATGVGSPRAALEAKATRTTRHPALDTQQAIGAIAHRLCRLIWKILHEGIRYEERGPAVSEEAKRVRTRKMIRELRSLGFRVEPAIFRERSSMIAGVFRPWPSLMGQATSVGQPR